MHRIAASLDCPYTEWEICFEEGGSSCLLAHPVTDPPSPSSVLRMRIETEFIKSFCGSEREEEDSLARATDVCTQTRAEERRDIASTCKWKDWNCSRELNWTIEIVLPLHESTDIYPVFWVSSKVSLQQWGLGHTGLRNGVGDKKLESTHKMPPSLSPVLRSSAIL